MTVLDAPTNQSSTAGLASDFAHAIGLDLAVRSAMEPPPIARTVGDYVAASSPEIDAIKARLASRGLLTTRPRVTVPEELRKAVEDGRPISTFIPRDVEEAISQLDEWDLPPGNEDVAVRCRQCHDVFMRPLEATRFVCPACDRGWRWAICGACDQMSFTVERQESWRCGCGAFNRSWWRTTTARREALAVVARRRQHALEAERRAVRDGMRRRRWKLVAFAVVAALVAVSIPVGFRLSQSQAGGTSATCAHWFRLRPAITNGTIVGDELDRELDALAGEAETADAPVRDAASALAAARLGTTAFLAARASLGDACEAPR